MTTCKTMSSLPPVTVACADNLDLVVDREAIKECCPPTLKHFLDFPDESPNFIAWTKPSCDAKGRLTFPKSFHIIRHDFAACISFLRSGYVEHLNPLVATFEILGGCKRLDDYIEQLKKKELMRERAAAERERAILANPLCPHLDHQQQFEFRAQYAVWTPSGTNWHVVSIVKFPDDDVERIPLFWWRRPRQSDMELED